MKCLFVFFLFIYVFPVSDFKTEQIKNERVKLAYLEKATLLETQLKVKNIKMASLQLYLQAFKRERIIAIWAKNKTDKTYQLLGEMPFCASSGKIGPKNMQG